VNVESTLDLVDNRGTHSYADVTAWKGLEDVREASFENRDGRLALVQSYEQQTKIPTSGSE